MVLLYIYIITVVLNCSTSTSWCRRGLKRVPRSRLELKLVNLARIFINLTWHDIVFFINRINPDQMTWGDVTVMSFLELKQTPQFGRADLLDDFPKLKTQYKSVQANPNVKIWLEIRPQTLK